MIEKAAIEKILSDFDSKKNTYEAFTRKVEHLAVELIGNAGFKPHTVTSRTKDRASLQKKLQIEDSNYELISDITDVAGVRITTFFHEDVDRIADVLGKEFDILPEFSIDKRKVLDPDRFGYLSLHYVVRLSPERRVLAEYRRFEDLRCEIQIRSILQHAWAEIEHDLGYKAKVEVPKEIRRQFSRLAGLLELADQEFERIRRDLDSYAKKLPEIIRERPNEVLLDKVSLNELLESDPSIKALDGYIASLFPAQLRNEKNSEMLLQLLHCVEILTAAQLSTSLKSQLGTLKKFSAIFLKNTEAKEAVGRGISILYLVYFLLAKKGDHAFIAKILDRFTIGRPDERIDFAQRLLNVFDETQKT